MAKDTHIVHIDSDLLTLGEATTDANMATYVVNLEALLEREFSCSIEVRGVMGGNWIRCATSDDIDERVREIETGDEWLGLLGSGLAS